VLTFAHSSLIDAPINKVFAFHEREDVLQILSPPFPRIQILERMGGIQVGSRVTLQLQAGPIKTRWVAQHTEFIQDRLFVDEQVSGPFRSWVHRHQFESVGKQTRLTDSVTFSMYGGKVLEAVAGRFVLSQLRKTFAYRHDATRKMMLPGKS